MSNELLPCPFCGGEAKIRDAGFNHESVMCRNDKCDGQGLRSKDKTEAIAVWNRRFVCLDKNGKKVFAGDEVNIYYRDAGSEVGRVEWDAKSHCWALHIENEGNYRFGSDTEIELIEES